MFINLYDLKESLHLGKISENLKFDDRNLLVKDVLVKKNKSESLINIYYNIMQIPEDKFIGILKRENHVL